MYYYDFFAEGCLVYYLKQRKFCVMLSGVSLLLHSYVLTSFALVAYFYTLTVEAWRVMVGLF